MKLSTIRLRVNRDVVPDTAVRPLAAELAQQQQRMLMFVIVAVLVCAIAFSGVSGRLLSGVVAISTSAALIAFAAHNAISARKTAQQLETMALASIEQAQFDALTRLHNRSAFTKRLDRALAAQSEVGAIGVVFFDLDGFKDVNDTLGHEAGDALLRGVAERLHRLALPDEMIARLGGDEFALVVQGEQAQNRVIEYVESVVGAMREPFSINDNSINVVISAGIALVEDEPVSRGELLRRADVAMYRAKSQSSGTYRLYAAEMDREVFLRRSIQNKLEQAISNKDLELFYQPIIGVKSGQLTGAEALVRWPRADGISVSPGEFIPVAESSGQILQLGRWALETALDRAKCWDSIPISVNVSPVQIRHHGFAKMLGDCLLNAGVSPERLKIEITEGVLISHADIAEKVIRQIRDLGVSLVLDDFGAGFSSLGYLRRFKFDTIKIDRSFVWDLKEGAQATQLVRAIIDLSHGLGMNVVAEGIENEEQRAILGLLGCDFLQGYHLGVPMNHVEFSAQFLTPPKAPVAIRRTA